MDKSEIKKKISEDPDFISSKKYENSLNSFMEDNRGSRNNDRLICTLLLLEPAELEKIWLSIVKKGRRFFRIDVE